MATSVFLSYRRLDDEVPPGEGKGTTGFVRYLQDQLKYELTRELGLPEDVLWYDRNKIQSADHYTTIVADAIRNSDILLAVVSRNYIQGQFCTTELQAFSQRFEQMERDARARRIFRADKQAVDENLLPRPLQDLQAVRFYDNDPERGELEYYYRGRVTQRNAYREAIRDLARSIYKRLTELGIRPVVPEARPLARKLSPNNRNVYVSLPAADTRDAYVALVKDLWARGYNVLPNGGQDAQNVASPESRPAAGLLASLVGPEVLATIRQALSTCEVAIHFVGEFRGVVPDGLDSGLVGLQLAEARAESQRRSEFRRLIWAPKVVPGSPEELAPRDPLEVLKRFDQFSASDEIVGDTAARFSDFVIQRLTATAPQVAASQTTVAAASSIFITYVPRDERVGLLAAKRLREITAGRVPIFFAPVNSSDDRPWALAKRAKHVLLCWGEADEMDVLETLDLPLLRAWRDENPTGHLCLLACSPESSAKRAMIEVGSFGPADIVMDTLAGLRPASLEPLLAHDVS